MAKLKGLGRGLDALLSGDVESEHATDGLKMLSVAQLQSGKYQPRTHMDDAALQTLAESIKAQGLMQPILVREIALEQYEIIAGERRWRAAQMAGLNEVPVLVREVADESAAVMALIENIQREDLGALEEAQGIKRLIDEFSMTHETAANAVGRSRSAASNLLRLLNLTVPVQQMLNENALEMGHARALLGLDGAQQVMLAEKVVSEHLSVRETESLVKKWLETDKNEHKTSAAKPTKTQDIKRLEQDLSDKIGASVEIKAGNNGAGVVKISYASLDQLDGLLARLK
jgi:ParB family chromosome partitioning protein